MPVSDSKCQVVFRPELADMKVASEDRTSHVRFSRQ
jgi:hypothetical protein